MKTVIFYGIFLLGLFWSCTKDEGNNDPTSDEPNFSFQITGEGISKTLSGKNIVFNSTTIDTKDLDGNPIELNTVVIIAQVKTGDVVEEVLISITDRTNVNSGVHPIGTDILKYYNAFTSYSADSNAGISFKASDGSIDLKTRTSTLVSGSLNVSAEGAGIKGTFTAPSL
ncbi:hypothetical protein K8352_12170 [Flavobacteriaceae bacterium F89]|uniref:Uncharacterized protein n=1 Tax=Cerina litoralis TaxID=2874477 RepID=A0AAE3EW93_9FLAO|nr:hypothetical protein [Cerina litoralis]MCG2461509.1 hypothetical protein [Cerina litoralis]